MRFARVCLLALALTSGCTRFGYHTVQAPPPDAAHDDGGAGEDAGGRPDAGATDASLPVAGGGGGAGMDGAVPQDLCPERADALFCDGFEDGLSRWSYPVNMNGTLELSSAEVHAGSSALHATTGASGSINAARYGAKVFDHQTMGDIWLRAYYFLPSSVVVNTNFSTVVLSEVEPPYFGFSLIVRESGLDITQGTTWYRSTTVFPRDVWTCVEMRVRIDPVHGEVEAFLNGVRVVRATETDTLPDRGYTSLDVGIHYTDSEQGPVEVFVDDVVAGKKRIGCN